MQTKPDVGEGLDAVLHQLKTQDNRIGGLEHKFDVVVTALNEVKSTINLLSAKPTFDVQKAISLCVQIGLLFSMVCTGLVWLSVQLSASDMTALKAADARVVERMSEMDRRIMRIENVAPGPGALQ